jgi:hypothetical protein
MKSPDHKISRKTVQNFTKIRPVGVAVFRVEGETWGTLIVRYRKYIASVPKTISLNLSSVI